MSVDSGDNLQIETEVSQVEDIEALKKALEEERARAETNLAGWQRAQADFINYRRRTEQEKGEISKFARAELVTALLPVLDNLERAFDSIPGALAEDGWVDGIKHIARDLQSVLEAQGLARIEAVGEPFDPNVHEAVMHGPGEEGIVVAEVKKGYKFGDRVIRPAAVVVGNGETEAEAKKEE